MGSHFLSLIEQGHLDVSSFSVVTFFLLFIFQNYHIVVLRNILNPPLRERSDATGSVNSQFHSAGQRWKAWTQMRKGAPR